MLMVHLTPSAGFTRFEKKLMCVFTCHNKECDDAFVAPVNCHVYAVRNVTLIFVSLGRGKHSGCTDSSSMSFLATKLRNTLQTTSLLPVSDKIHFLISFCCCSAPWTFPQTLPLKFSRLIIETSQLSPLFFDFWFLWT